MHAPTRRLIVVLIFLAVGGQFILWTLADYDPVESTLKHAKARLELGDISRPRDLVLHLTVRYPERADAWAALAEVDAQIGDAPCILEARAAIATALACHDTPDHLAKAHRVQGLLLLLDGEAKGGAQALESAARDGDAGAARALALLALVQGRPDAGSRLRVALDSLPGDEALTAAIASTNPSHADAMAAADPNATVDEGGWPLYMQARHDVAASQDGRAAALLQRALLGLGRGRLSDQLSLPRAAILADPVFAAAGGLTSAVIQRWPERAPWQGVAAATTPRPSP